MSVFRFTIHEHEIERMVAVAGNRTGTGRWLEAMHRVGLTALAALALTPLVIDLRAWDDSFMAPKWAWIAIWTALGVASVLARALAGRAAMFPFEASWIAAVLFAAWHWASVGWASSPALAVDRAARVTWLTLALWLGLQLLHSRRTLLWLARALIGVAALTAAWVLAEDAIRAWWPQRAWVRPNLPDWRGWLSAGLGNTSHIGDLLALAMVPALVMLGTARLWMTKAWLIGALVLLPAGMIVSFSAGANLSLIVGAAVAAGLIAKHRGGRWFGRRKGRWIALGACWAGVLLFFLTPHALNPHAPSIWTEGFGSERWQEGGPTRLAIWAQALEMIRLHPTPGVGAGNFTYVFPSMDSALTWENPELRVYQGVWTNAAHNVFLQAWSELGAVGLFLLLALLGAAFFALLKDLDRARTRGVLTRAAIAGMLAAWIAQGQVNFVLQTPSGALVFYGILLAVALERRTRPERTPMPPLRVETGWAALRVDWHTMRKPNAVGGALLLPPQVAIPLGALLLAAAVAWAPMRLAPVRAQREYRRAREAPTAEMAWPHYRRGLEIDPGLVDLRSNYSQWLVDNGKPDAALKEIAIVRERLASNELYLREAQAQAQLGEVEKARAAMKELYKRMWSAQMRGMVLPGIWPVEGKN